MNSPYLSIVLTGRNDNYGGDFRSRLQRCITNTHRLLTKHGIQSEIIFVNYNPLDTESPIQEFINWPEKNSIVTTRVVTVPPNVHKELVKVGERKDVPVLEYLGKNAGIRRAEGEFILSMNPDIILPENLVSKLGSLDKGMYYRVDRIDFEGDLEASPKYTRLFLKGQDYRINSISEISALRIKNAILNSWITFTPKIEGLLNRISSTVYYDNSVNIYHCNVSGDFMLMHRDCWFKLHGHHENTAIALHVDSLMVIQAAALGLHEKVFSQPIFHQEHARRYDATEANPMYEHAFKYFISESNAMLDEKEAAVYNDQDWGLVKFDLPELNP